MSKEIAALADVGAQIERRTVLAKRRETLTRARALLESGKGRAVCVTVPKDGTVRYDGFGETQCEPASAIELLDGRIEKLNREIAKLDEVFDIAHRLFGVKPDENEVTA